MHKYFELELVVHGTCRQVLNGVTYDMRPGSIYLVTPADFHQVTMQSGDTVRTLNIAFDHWFSSSEIIKSLMNRNDALFTQLDNESYARIRGLLDELFNEIINDDNFTGRGIKNILECLIIYILRNAQHERHGLDNAENLQMALRYLYLHFADSPDVSEMSKMCGYSLGYFCRIFKETTGQTYNDFLASLKINNAKIMLLSSDMQICDIALNCGFSSISNFNRVFKEKNGVSPTQFIKNNKKR